MQKTVKKTAKKAVKKKGKARADKEFERRLEVLDPRQAAAMQNLYDPNSPTFGNYTQSFIKAGFSREYAENVTHLAPEWLSAFIGEDSPMIAKATRNLNKFLDLKTDKIEIGENGAVIYEDAERTIPKKIEDPRLLEIQLKATTFVQERLNRKKFGKDDKIQVGFHFDMKPLRDLYAPKPKELETDA